MIRQIIEYSAKNRFVVILGVVFLLGWGAWSLRNIPLDAIPDLSDVQVIVFAEWQGRSPDLVEDQITYPIVTSMLSAPKVKVVRGQSFFGLSFVYIIFEDGTDMYWARSRVLEYMQGVADQLPKGVTPVLGPDATGVGWVYEYALVDDTGKHDLSELRTFQDWYLRYALQAVPGVAEVASVGGYVKQYQVDVDPNKLLAYNLPLRKITQAIRRGNNDVGGRVVEFTGIEYMVRGRGYIKSVADIEQIAVGADRHGTPILLRDVARVHLGPDMRRGLVELDGEGEVVGGIVVMRYGENALEVINRVKAKLEELKPSFPEGVRLVVTYDRSSLILRAIATLKEKLLEESVIVSLVSIVFLFHVRSALVAIITLPVAILLAFIPMYYLGLTSNVMSLGGIAIAMGILVDAAIVMVENAHKRLEQDPDPAHRTQVIIEAAKEVGRPLFFSLLIIAVAIMPIFTLEAQEGRLFKPLAFTNTFAMFFAALLSVTLVPLLMVFLIRGRIVSEERNPVNRFLIALYMPVARWALKNKVLVLMLAVGLMVATAPAFMRLGSEFMPPLYEGTVLAMPTTLPGVSIAEAAKLLQKQDRVLKSFPEVERVFGKIGRARTSTDSAPLSMVETIITLKPQDQWRPGMTYDGLINEFDKALQWPGVTNAWTMPIKARTDMLTTGIRTPVGIKIVGSDLKEIQKIGENLEMVVRPISGTRSVYAERVTGGYFIDFNVRREEISRYGLSVADVEDVIESAIGGKNITMTVEGRERYPVNVRYARELRDDLDRLKRVLVPTPVGAQVPLVQLADIQVVTGPPMIRDEDGMLTGYVFVDVAEDRDLGSFVQEAQATVREKVKLPSGYTLTWSGQYEYMVRAKERLKLVIPLTVFLIFILLYFNFQSVAKALVVVLSLPFAVVGAIWLLWALGYNLSVAVGVGMIGLAGVAAEIGVVMLVFLDSAYEKRRAEGRIKGLSDLHETVIEGSVRRVRPIMMTAMAVIGGLLPILWSHGTGADVMKRIAAPMVGGMVTATLLTLVVIPVIYALWRGRSLKKEESP